jgi:hypothetical protein
MDTVAWFALESIHRKRKESDLSHPVTRPTLRPTRHIKHSELPKLKTALADGYLEMWVALGLQPSLKEYRLPNL